MTKYNVGEELRNICLLSFCLYQDTDSATTSRNSCQAEEEIAQGLAPSILLPQPLLSPKYMSLVTNGCGIVVNNTRARLSYIWRWHIMRFTSFPAHYSSTDLVDSSVQCSMLVAVSSKIYIYP